MSVSEENLKQIVMEELEHVLLEKCWPGYEKKGMKKMFGKMYPNCVKKKKRKNENTDLYEAHGLSKEDVAYIKKVAQDTDDSKLKKILNFLVKSNVEVDVTQDVTKMKKAKDE